MANAEMLPRMNLKIGMRSEMGRGVVEWARRDISACLFVCFFPPNRRAGFEGEKEHDCLHFPI